MVRLLLAVAGLFIMAGFSVTFVGGVLAVVMSRTMVLMKLLGAIRAFEFMAFARNGKRGDGHKKDGK